MKYLKIALLTITKSGSYIIEGYKSFPCSGKFISFFFIRSEEKTTIQTTGIEEYSQEIDPFSLN